MEDVDQSHAVLEDCMAGDVKQGPSLRFETEGEESGCQFAFIEGGRNQTDSCLSYAKYWFYSKPIKNMSRGGF